MRAIALGAAVVLLAACGPKTAPVPAGPSGKSAAPAGLLKIQRPAYDKSQTGWQKTVEPPGKVAFDPALDYFATLKTSIGSITLKFFPDVAPRHVAAFVNLAEIGYYDGTPFHRVIPGFMMQGGDWTGTGTGGPDYVLRNEFNDRKHVKGALSAARTSDPDSAGSQFFICFKETPFLDRQYTVFGEVVSGLEVVDAFEKLGSASGKPSRLERILSVEVFTKPKG